MRFERRRIVLSPPRGFIMHSDGNPRPADWTELYQLAVLESDPTRLPQRISEARTAILDRIEETLTKPYPYQERQQLTDALNSLRAVQQEYEGRIRRYGEPRTENRLKYGGTNSTRERGSEAHPAGRSPGNDDRRSYCVDGVGMLRWRISCSRLVLTGGQCA